MWKNKIIVGLSLLLIMISAYKIYEIFNEYNDSSMMYSTISDTYTTNIYNKSNGDDITEYDDKLTIENNDALALDYEYLDFRVDFDGLYNLNSEIIGWIRFDDEIINYPIVQTVDNEKYLSVGVDNTKNRCGAIFVDCKNVNAFNDYHTIIYGHNMKDGSMFGQLKKYESDSDYMNKNEYFTIYIRNKALRYKVFACYKVDANDDNIYMLGFEPNDEYQAFIDRIAKRNIMENTIIPTIKDRIVTLSTCSGENYRFIVNAYLTDSVEY